MKKTLIAISLFLLLTKAHSQCIDVTSASFIRGSQQGVWSLKVNWTASGTKHLRVKVFNDTSELLTTCFQINSVGNSSGAFIYDGIVCNAGSEYLTATFDAYEGLCGETNVTQCRETQYLYQILELKFGYIRAKNIGNITNVVFKVATTNDENKATFNFTLPNGMTKKYNIVFPQKLKPLDIWEVNFNNVTKTYTTKKL